MNCPSSLLSPTINTVLSFTTAWFQHIGVAALQMINGTPLQYSRLENPQQRRLVGSSPWGCKKSDMTEWLHFHFSLSCIGEGNGNPLQCSCLENPRDSRAWWAAIYGVAQSQTWLKQFSSSSSSRWANPRFGSVAKLWKRQIWPRATKADQWLPEAGVVEGDKFWRCTNSTGYIICGGPV